MEKAIKAAFKFAADNKGELMDYLGLRHKSGNPADGSDIPQSASFLFNNNGEVIWSYVAENYRVRPKPQEILAAARQYVDKH
mgnify:CR=1 FL=1